MPALLVNHRVADFDTWLKVFAEHEAERAMIGASASIVWQAYADPHNVFILIKGVDPGQAAGFTNSAELKQRMQDGGVIGEPTFTLLGDAQKFPH